MKYCPHEGFRYPDEASTCHVCGESLITLSSLDDLPDYIELNLLSSCCPNPACKNLVAASGTNFCASCGSELEQISYEVWIEKFVEPAFANQLATALLDKAVLFRPVVEMGLSQSKARELFEHFVERR